MLIAAAPDFTERMLLKACRRRIAPLLQREGRLERPSQYSPEPSVFTWKLIEEGRNHLVLDKKLALPCPVRLLHGQSDPDVPWEYSLQIAQHLEAPEVDHDLHQGRRSPPQHPGRHRPPDRDGRGARRLASIFLTSP